MCLGWASGFSDSTFLDFFFFFLQHVNSNFTWVYCIEDKNYCSHTIYHCSRTKKILKISPTVLFIHLKIILLCIFSFQFLILATINSIQTDPIASCKIDEILK